MELKEINCTHKGLGVVLKYFLKIVLKYFHRGLDTTLNGILLVL